MSSKSKPLTFKQILNLKENNYTDFQMCFDFIKKYIENINKYDFQKDKVINLRALVDKYLQFAIPIEVSLMPLMEDLNKHVDLLETSCYKHTFKDVPTESAVSRNRNYQNLYTVFIQIYNKIDQYFRTSKFELLEFDGLINYDISNKKKAISIIEEAIELIQNDVNLSTTSKKIIINALTEALKELHNPKTNWKNFFVKVSEIIIVLGALGEITGGAEAGYNLLKAKNEVERAKIEIVNTSYNLNYQNVNKTFNITKNIEIENNQILFIE